MKQTPSRSCSHILHHLLSSLDPVFSWLSNFSPIANLLFLELESLPCNWLNRCFQNSSSVYCYNISRTKYIAELLPSWSEYPHGILTFFKKHRKNLITWILTCAITRSFVNIYYCVCFFKNSYLFISSAHSWVELEESKHLNRSQIWGINYH